MDHHVHTSLCHHAEGTPEEYVLAGVEKGLPFLGFNDHFPMPYLPPTIPVEEYSMNLDEFPGFMQELKHLREKYAGSIEIKISTEVDFYAPAIEEIKRLLSPFMANFDYIYGSVHVIDDWAVDDSRFLARYDTVDINEVWIQYYESVRSMASSKLFDVVGHFDLPKKYNKIPTRNLSSVIDVVLDEIKAAGMVVEVNTAGLRKPVKEIYPSRAILEQCYEKGIDVLLGSDAHVPSDVGADFDKAKALLIDIGFERLATFKKRKISHVAIQ